MFILLNFFLELYIHAIYETQLASVAAVSELRLIVLQHAEGLKVRNILPQCFNATFKSRAFFGILQLSGFICTIAMLLMLTQMSGTLGKGSCELGGAVVRKNTCICVLWTLR